MPTITISQPTKNGVVDPKGFPVAGLAMDAGMPEPHSINSVTVQVDNGPVTTCTLKTIPDKKQTVVSFNGTGSVTGGGDPHIVKVVATNDIGGTSKQAVSVVTVAPPPPPPVSAAPAVYVEISPELLDPANQNDQIAIHKLQLEIQKSLTKASSDLASIGQILAGPNLIVSDTHPQGGLVLRLGVWIVGPAFPLLHPADLPLPVLPDPAVAPGFLAVPFLPLPPIPDPITQGLIAFGISIPTTTLQSIVNDALPSLNATASKKGVSLDSITITCSPPGTVTTSIVGRLTATVPPNPVNGTITEMLGTTSVPGAQPPQSVPTILPTSSYSAGSDVLDQVLIGLISPVFLFPFLLEAVIVHVGVPIAFGQVASQAASIVSSFVASLPGSVSFRGGTSDFLGNFPILIPNWTRFGTANSGLLGLGTLLLETRTQAMVALTIDGPSNIGGFQIDLAGGVSQTYDLSWTNLIPDSDKFTWKLFEGNTEVDGGIISFAPGSQQGSIDATFPLPQNVKPGSFRFTLTVDATETSGRDASQTLRATPKMNVTVTVKKNPKKLP
jgi:hypothetical protein